MAYLVQGLMDSSLDESELGYMAVASICCLHQPICQQQSHSCRQDPLESHDESVRHAHQALAPLFGCHVGYTLAEFLLRCHVLPLTFEVQLQQPTTIQQTLTTMCGSTLGHVPLSPLRLTRKPPGDRCTVQWQHLLSSAKPSVDISGSPREASCFEASRTLELAYCECPFCRALLMTPVSSCDTGCHAACGREQHAGWAHPL